MIQKLLNQIDESDLQLLKTNGVTEGKTIEYKKELPGNADADKKEFLADISSFANTIGGDLIYGIEEAKGIPSIIEGLLLADLDAEISRVENIVRSGLNPRIMYVIKAVPLENGKTVLLIRIEKSWIGPHRVIFQSHDKFYARNSSGKYPMDVSELRAAFNLSDTVVAKIQNFRVERITEIFANKTPVPFEEGPKIVLHLVPLEAFASRPHFAVLSAKDKLQPIYAGGWNYRINLEGLLCFTGGRRGQSDSYSYTQIYRNGMLEAVTSGLFTNKEAGRLQLASISYEQHLLKFLPQALGLLKSLGVTPPIFVSLTLLNAKDCELTVDRFNSFGDEDYPIGTDLLSLPESTIEDFSVDPISILRPMFDLIWNACGYPRSFNFDENGKWSAR